MSNVYFAKFNINAEIYDVYSGKTDINKLLNKIYNEINEEERLYEDKATYKFISLDKLPDKSIINGRIVYYGPGTNTSYDATKDDVTEELDENKARYVTFSFDVENEIIGFVPRNNFGYKQFLERFKKLVEACADIEEVELFLETDAEDLEQRINFLKKIQKIEVELIPPNNDREDFKMLFGQEAQDLQDTGATKFYLKLTATSKRTIKSSSKYVKRLLKAVGLGYGQMTIIGKNTSGEDVRIKSNDDTPFLRPISEYSKTSIPDVAEKTRAGISDLRRLKATRKVREIEQGDDKTEKQ